MNDVSSAAMSHPSGAGEFALLVRKARMSDLVPLLQLINGYASQGAMLPRTEFELSESIRDFTVAESGGRLAGCGALHFYGPTAAEVRSLAVEPAVKGLGVGRQIVEALEAEALDQGLSFVFAFTYVPGFFEKLGFLEVDRNELPAKVWKDCLRCPKFQSCDEIAMKKILASTPECGVVSEDDAEATPLPTLRK
ncbi:MAG: N-acetyltransferase [Bryobacteraceae bacterium]